MVPSQELALQVQIALLMHGHNSMDTVYESTAMKHQAWAWGLAC